MNITNVHQSDTGDSVQKVAVRPIDPADAVAKSAPVEGKKAGDQAERVEELKQQQNPDVSDVKEMAQALNEYMDILQTNLGWGVQNTIFSFHKIWNFHQNVINGHPSNQWQIKHKSLVTIKNNT